MAVSLRRPSMLTLAAGLATALCHGRAAGSLPLDASLVLTAVCDAGTNQPAAIEVALRAPLGGRPVFRLADRVFGSPGMADLVSDASASDDRGALPLVRRIATDRDGGRVLELAAERRAVGAVTLRYRARSVVVADAGARHGLRHDATGIGGLGDYFLVLPESRRVHRIAIAWAPAACAAAGAGMSSFGGGTAETTGALDTLRGAAYFFGRPRLVTVDDGALHVRAAWFGEPALDVDAATRFAARAFAAERALFRDTGPAELALFVRVLPAMGARSTGIAQPGSLVLAIGPRTPFGPRLRTNLAHEMLHRWLGHRLRFAGPDGAAAWFTEGFTVYLANLVLLRAGLIAPGEFVAELDATARRHFANDRAAASNDEIRRGFFQSDALSIVPYTRGALYAAELDAAIRRASHGARSLGDVLGELDRASRSASGTTLDIAGFRRIVARDAGPAAVARFDTVIVRGGRPEPPSDAFGPCFARESRAIPPFQLGFDEPQSLAEHAIRKRVPDSAAARAGLAEGDRLVALDVSPLDPGSEAVVTVERGGRPVEIRYLPAGTGPPRNGYQWVRIAGIDDARCAAW